MREWWWREMKRTIGSNGARNEYGGQDVKISFMWYPLQMITNVVRR